MTEEIVDVHALHRRYTLPASWWYAQAEAGKIPCFKLGRYLRFKVSEVEAWLETQRRGPRPENGR